MKQVLTHLIVLLRADEPNNFIRTVPCQVGCFVFARHEANRNVAAEMRKETHGRFSHKMEM